MIEIARISTFAISNRREIVLRLMGCSEFFKRISFAKALAAYRSAERAGLVTHGDGWIAVYHDYIN